MDLTTMHLKTLEEIEELEKELKKISRKLEKIEEKKSNLIFKAYLISGLLEKREARLHDNRTSE